MSDDRPAVSAEFRTVVVVTHIVSPSDPEQFVAHFKEGPDQHQIVRRSTRSKALGTLAWNFPESFGLLPGALYLHQPAEDIGELILSDPDRHRIAIEDRSMSFKGDPDATRG